MGDTILDLYKIDFWLALGIALVVLVALTSALWRKWAWAFINLGFLCLVMRLRAVAVVLGGAVAAYLLLQLMAKNRFRLLALAIAGGGVLLLFLLHKLPRVSAELGSDRLNPIMATIGFSYVALRLVDVSRMVFESRSAAPDLPSTINYLLPFHMLAAGPIQAYDEFVSQPDVPPALRISQALGAVERIALGLFKKFVVATVIERVFLTGFRAGGPYFLLEVQLNFLWVYLDFSAYSDIAVGAGQLMGVATPENFNKPYLARNPIDFWERWHISLSLFIRRHIFIPLQLWLVRRTDGHKPLMAASLAYTAAFLLCGLWHQINLRWLLWGGTQALGLMACNLYRHALTDRIGQKAMKRYLTNRWIRAAAVCLTFEFAAFSLVIVRYPYQETW